MCTYICCCFEGGGVAVCEREREREGCFLREKEREKRSVLLEGHREREEECFTRGIEREREEECFTRGAEREVAGQFSSVLVLCVSERSSQCFYEAAQCTRSRSFSWSDMGGDTSASV